MVSLWKWLDGLDVNKSSAYLYVKKYQDELQALGCIVIKRTPKMYRIYVVDGECIIRFFEERGIFLKEVACG